jgi:hypothetical protein
MEDSDLVSLVTGAIYALETGEHFEEALKKMFNCYAQCKCLYYIGSNNLSRGFWEDEPRARRLVRLFAMFKEHLLPCHFEYIKGFADPAILSGRLAAVKAFCECCGSRWGTDDDIESLGALYEPDKGEGSEILEYLVQRYPQILEVTRSGPAVLSISTVLCKALLYPPTNKLIKATIEGRSDYAEVATGYAALYDNEYLQNGIISFDEAITALQPFLENTFIMEWLLIVDTEQIVNPRAAFVRSCLERGADAGARAKHDLDINVESLRLRLKQVTPERLQRASEIMCCPLAESKMAKIMAKVVKHLVGKH